MSLLLDALKKAALEKQRREQSASGITVPVPPAPVSPGRDKSDKPHASSPAQELLVEEHAESTILVSPIDVGSVNAQALDEYVADIQPHLNHPDTSSKMSSHQNVAELSLIDVHTELASDSSTPAADSVADHHGDGLVFDIDEIDSEYLKPVPSLNEEQPIIPEEKAIVDEFVRNARAPAEPLASDFSSPINTLSTKKVERGESAAGEVESFSAADLEPRAGKTEPHISTRSPVEVFSASSGKLALAQLLEKSKKAANYSRKRMMLMYMVLTVTALLLVFFYYYLLHSNADTLVNLPVATSATIPPMPAEANPETAAPVANAGENEVVTGAVNMARIVETPVVEPSNPETIATDDTDSTVEPTLATRPNANRARQRAVPNQDYDTNYSLPRSTAPRQAMIVQHQAAENAVSEAIARGYSKYQQGDFAGAGLAYSEALQQDPHQRDALLGAAAVAVREGRQQDALNFYQRRLARDPKDEYAQAGILGLSTSSEANPQLDSELATLLNEYPDAAHLHFLQGSLFAARQQWAAAQLSFFEAWRRDNKNPDIAFNLAIALDHLAQPKEAVRFYQQALVLGGAHPVGFSIEAVQQRLQQLSTNQEGVTP